MVIAITFLTSCVPQIQTKVAKTPIPETFQECSDTLNQAQIKWRDYFKDSALVALIDTALGHNQELSIRLQEMLIYKNEIEARKGEYLPSVNLKAGAGLDKKARYTPLGASEVNTEIEPGKAMPDPVPDFTLGAVASWEIDIWNKLHQAKDAAAAEYLASVEGRNFMITQLITEIASTYYELLALDNQKEILQRNIQIQSNALEIVRLQKQASKVNELAVKRFEAQVFRSKSMLFQLNQAIVANENKLNLMIGKYQNGIKRHKGSILDIEEGQLQCGEPLDLLENRPDIRAAAQELQAANLKVKVAKADFYPSLGLNGRLGLQAFNPSYLLIGPESLLFGLAGDISSPLVNRRALKANYKNAGARQVKAAFEYEQKVLSAYLEVSTQVAKLQNLKEGLALRRQEVDALNQSVSIVNDLFKSARADYMEVLMTQRDALESKFELIETKKEQLISEIRLYQTLGGGWRWFLSAGIT